MNNNSKTFFAARLLFRFRGIVLLSALTQDGCNLLAGDSGLRPSSVCERRVVWCWRCEVPLFVCSIESMAVSRCEGMVS